MTSEGYRCPFIGIINTGECHVLRKVDVPFINSKTGLKEKRMKQVVVGKLSANESFGEISVTMKGEHIFTWESCTKNVHVNRRRYPNFRINFRCNFPEIILF